MVNFLISCLGTPIVTYKYLIQGQFSKKRISCPGITGATYKYILYDHFSKKNYHLASYPWT